MPDTNHADLKVDDRVRHSHSLRSYGDGYLTSSPDGGTVMAWFDGDPTPRRVRVADLEPAA
jgi:hypothetical protein